MCHPNLPFGPPSELPADAPKPDFAMHHLLYYSANGHGDTDNELLQYRIHGIAYDELQHPRTLVYLLRQPHDDPVHPTSQLFFTPQRNLFRVKLKLNQRVKLALASGNFLGAVVVGIKGAGRAVMYKVQVEKGQMVHVADVVGEHVGIVGRRSGEEVEVKLRRQGRTVKARVVDGAGAGVAGEKGAQCVAYLVEVENPWWCDREDFVDEEEGGGG